MNAIAKPGNPTRVALDRILDVLLDHQQAGGVIHSADLSVSAIAARALREDDAASGDPFSDEALGQRSAEAIAQDDRQAADFGGHEPTYHAALVVIANEEGAGRYARAINLVARIWQKDPNEVLRDACSL